MFWALLAKFLLRQPAWVQAVCSASAPACHHGHSQRQPTRPFTRLHSRDGLAWGTAAAAGFYMGFRVQNRHGALADHTAPRWLYALYAVVWLLGIAAVIALVGDGGFKVAVVAIVPLVLLAPTALYGLRQVPDRVPA